MNSGHLLVTSRSSCSRNPHIQIIRTFTSDSLKENAHKKSLIHRTGKQNEIQIKQAKMGGKLTRFVWRLRRLKQNDNVNKKTTAEEAIQNNRNIARKNGHENMKNRTSLANKATMSISPKIMQLDL